MHTASRPDDAHPDWLDPRGADSRGLAGFRRKLPAHPQHPHAATVRINPRVEFVPQSLLSFRIYEIEKKTKTVEKFRFPQFETINWFAAQSLCEQMHELNVQEKTCPSLLLVGLKVLLPALKLWNTEKDVSAVVRISNKIKGL